MTSNPNPRKKAEEMRAFVLRRTEDISGVSGTGDVAEGAEFSDGTVSLRWLSANPTSVVFHDNGIASVEAVHGHSGATKIVWLDGRGNLEARREADLRDEVTDLRKEVGVLRDKLATKSTEYDVLTVRAQDGGISDDEIDRLADAVWAKIGGRIAASVPAGSTP
jgi:hypothetical protein